MSLTLHRIVWSDAPAARTVTKCGMRAKRSAASFACANAGRELWRWTQSGIFQPTHGPNGGVADSLDEAKAAFRAAWERRLLRFQSWGSSVMEADDQAHGQASSGLARGG
jgi:hypothetical protein